jgi:rRNA maturation RNase YbeY
MILFCSETKFTLANKKPLKNWLLEVVKKENKKIGALNIVFYNDQQLLEFNKQYLNHDTFTDVITFDYSEGNILHGDICISVERVTENAKKYNFTFGEELRRVIVHGILHLCGYQDKKIEEKQLMKHKEEEALTFFNTHYNL